MLRLLTENTLVEVKEMKEGYKLLGEFIRQVDIRNTEGKEDNLLGVSVQKQFIPSIANTVGTDFTKYKVVKKGQFTYIPDTSRRGDKIGIALLQDYEEGLVSNVYTVFEVIDTEKLLPEYLMLWFSRPEFDRYARFKSHGSVREVMDWDEMCKVELPVPAIEKQRNIVNAYKAITDRIALKKQINDNLEATSQAIYKEMVSRADSEKQDSIYSILSVINGSPFSSELFNSEKRGYPLVRIRDLPKCTPDIYTDEVINKVEYVNVGDILIGMDGEFIPHIWYGHKGVLNQRVCKVIPIRATIHPLFLYLTLKPILAEVQRTQGGTTVIHIGKKDFDRMVCVSLTEEEHIAFSRKVSPLYNRMLENYQEMLLLSQMQTDILSLLSR
jgi:restriction endonuclease S subunit